MSPLTDDRIAELVREAFVAHEDLADPRDVAIASGPPPRRRGWVVAALGAAAAAIVAGVAVIPSVTDDGHAPPPRGPVRPTGTPAATDAANQAATERLARRMLASVPMLPGGRALDRAPVRGLVTGTETIDYSSTNTVQRTAWWTAPGSVDAAVAYYRGHPPAGFTARDGGSSSDGSSTVTMVQYTDARRDPAYTTRYLLLSVVPHRRGVAVRADTFVNWRPARTGSSLVGETVHAIDVRVRRAKELGDLPHVVRRARVTDPQAIATILHQVNGYNGAVPLTHSCPMMTGPVVSYVLRFRTGYGPVEMIGSTGCTGSVQLLRRGEPSGPPLDATTAFARLVRRLAR